jgi:hypothetical protein
VDSGVKQFNVAVNPDLVRTAGGPAGTRLQDDAFDSIDAALSCDSSRGYGFRSCFLPIRATGHSDWEPVHSGRVSGARGATGCKQLKAQKAGDS